MDHPAPQPPQAGQETRFHYPQYKKQQSTPGHLQPSQYQQYQQYQPFPPHPSVRPPPNAKLSPRQVPAGVGIAPPPVKYEGQQRLQPWPAGNGVMVQDFKFPPAPPIPESEASQSSGRKYNMHESYVSSVLDDFASPRTTPGSRSRGFTPSKRYSGSVYAESEALGVDERYDQSLPSPGASRAGSPNASPQIVRQASLGKRAKPAVTTIKNRASQLDPYIPEHTLIPSPNQPSRSATMDALSAAVATGINNRPVNPQLDTQGSRSYTPVRMPFDTSPPGSPTGDREFLQTPISPNTIASGMMLDRPPGSGHSHNSTNALLGLGIDQNNSMSNKIPESRRPPKLDMEAVREAENRGSTTSLADLIKRATRLAANLDRGRTASRLGMLDMWGSNEKLGNGRHSTMSDMISAFPAPAAGGTPTTRRDNAWPLGEKGDAYASTTDLSKTQPPKQRRKCCGMSLPVFFAVLLVVIVLIAAAVLIPIFLVLVPKQHSDSVAPTGCAASHPCRNGGTRIVSGDSCACVCSNGFTGSQCDTLGNTEDCMTLTLGSGSNEYKNATIGLSVMPSLSDAQSRFEIPINVSTILSLFSSNNLSCTSENSLVDFNSSAFNQAIKEKRFVIIPGLEPHPAEQPPAIHGESKRADFVEELRLERREDEATVGTSNGIVFQAPSTTIGAIPTVSASIGTDVSTVTSVGGTTIPSPSATGSGTASVGPSATSSSGTTPSSAVTDDQVDFAQVVVLYVLQESRAVSVAVTAQQQMESFFSAKTEGNSTSSVDLDVGDLHLTANFDAFSITASDGQVIGGKKGT